MLVHPFYGQTSTLTVWACGKQNLTLGRKGGGGGGVWIPPPPPIRFF